MPTDRVGNEQQYGGLNQRIEPVLLPVNVHTHTEGVVYRSGMACRMEGKQLYYKFNSTICNIANCYPNVIIQTLTNIYLIPMSALFSIPIPSDDLTDEFGNILTNELSETLTIDS